MKICLLTPTFFPKVGGAEQVVYSIAKELQRKGHTPFVITQVPRRLSYDDSIYSFPVIRYKRPWSFKLSLAMNPIRKTILHLNREHKFDLIHAHMAYPSGFIAAELKEKERIPIVITPHGSDIRETSRYRKSNIIWKRIIYALDTADAITAISKYMQEIIEKILSKDKGKIRLIPNGIDFEEFNKKIAPPPDLPSEAQTKQRYILYIGGIKRRKGVDILIEAAKILKERGLSDLKILIAGDGKEKDKIKELIALYGLNENAKLIGIIQGKGKVYLLQNAAAQVIPSRIEPLGIVALEGMAAGCLVIASAVGGLTDIIEDQKTGILIRPEDPLMLADAINYILTTDLEDIKSKARQAAQKYDWSNIVDQYIRLYKELI